MPGQERFARLDDAMLRILSQAPPESGPRRMFQLSTTSSQGRPHVALLGDAELHAPDTASVRLLVWSSSSTAGNLKARPQVLLTYVDGGSFVAVDLAVETTRLVNVIDRSLLLVSAVVVGARRDRVPYAAITTGPTFTLLDESVQERWHLSTGLLRSMEA